MISGQRFAVVSFTLMAMAAPAAFAVEPEVAIWVTKRSGVAIAEVKTLSDLRVGETVEAEVRVTPGTGGVGSYSVSFRYDVEGDDVLNRNALLRLAPDGFSAFPVPTGAPDIESGRFLSGQMNSVAGISLPPSGGRAEGSAPFAIATLRFTAASEGTTAVESGAFNSAVDGILLQDAVSTASPGYGGIVLAVPEPQAAWRVLSALVCVLAVGRRTRAGWQRKGFAGAARA